MFGISMPELILVLAVALIVIGPKKLPDLAKSLGKAMNEFRRATSEIKESFEVGDEFNDVKKSLNDIKDDVTSTVTKIGDTEEMAQAGDGEEDSSPREMPVKDEKETEKHE